MNSAIGHDIRTRRHGARRLLSSLLATLLVAGGLVGVEAATTTAPVQAAGPITGTPAPDAAFPMMPGTTLLAFSTVNDGYKGATPQTLHAYTKAGESFQALFHRTSLLTSSAAPGWATNIKVTSPTGVVYTQVIPGNAAAGSQWGFLKGSLPSEEGIWTVDLTAASTAPAGRVLLRSYSAVYSGAVEMPGRMWSESLQIYQPSSNIDLPIHFMSSLGYIYKADYRGYWGLNSFISADAVGIVPVDNGVVDCSTSLYHSVPLNSATATAALGECGGSYRVFWQTPFQNDAATAIPVTTARAGASASSWVRPTVQPPAFDLVNFVGDDDTMASGDLIADVDNFFGNVGIEVLDVHGAVLRSFTVNVPEGTLPRQVPLRFDGRDDSGAPIARETIATFKVSGLSAGEIHFVLGDVERLVRGMSISVLNGPTAGTPEASRVYWADSDGWDGTTYCNAPDASVDTAEDGFLSDGYPNGYGTRCWGTAANGSGSGWGDTLFVDTWAKQGVASTSSLTLHDPQALYSLEKAVLTTGAVLPGGTLDYALTIRNTSAHDLWDLYDVKDDLSGVLDDAVYNNDAAISKSWTDLPDVGSVTFDAADESLTYRGNIPAGKSVTIRYSVTTQVDPLSRGDHQLANSVAGPSGLPPQPCAIAGCRSTLTPVKELVLDKALQGAPVQNANGTWSLVYTLEVRNEGGAAEPYALADTLRFGAGISVVASSASPVGGALTPSSTWDGTADTVLASGSIAAGATHRYLVNVTAAVANGVIGTTPALCATSQAGGFGNRATLTASSAPVVTLTDSACAAPSRPSLQKDLINSMQNSDGSWTLAYRILVGNSSPNTLNYSLSDTLRFAQDATVRAAASTVTTTSGATLSTPAWNGVTALPIASGVSLPGATGSGPTLHEYVLTVTADLSGSPDFTAPMWACPTPESSSASAFNNVASLTSGADTVSDTACGLPVNPSVYKTVESQPTQQTDGTWTLQYAIRVVNAEESPSSGLVYALDDALDYPAGIDVNSLVVTSPSGISVSSGFTAGLARLGGIAVTPGSTLLAGWSATIPAAVAGIPSEHVFLVTVNVTVPTGLPLADLDCGATGSGFRNNVTLTAAANGALAVPSSACADIPAAASATIEKTLVSSAQADSGVWTLVYGIAVENEDALHVARYTLSDTLDFGTDVTVGSATVSVSPSGVSLSAPAWNGGTSAVIARDVVLAAGARHQYQVTVTATPAASRYSGAETACTPSASGGFRNTAALSTGIDGPSTSEACAPMLVPRLSVTKSSSAPTAAAIGDTVRYTVTATNSGTGTFTTVNPARVIDDLVGVLDDARFNADAASSAPGTLGYSEPRLTWSGVLRPGAAVHVTYSVTVTGGGDLVLRNVAFAAGSGCAPGACLTPLPADCVSDSCGFTETNVTPPVPILPVTGPTGVAALVWIGFFALALGSLATGWSAVLRRREV